MVREKPDGDIYETIRNHRESNNPSGDSVADDLEEMLEDWLPDEIHEYVETGLHSFEISPDDILTLRSNNFTSRLEQGQTVVLSWGGLSRTSIHAVGTVKSSEFTSRDQLVTVEVGGYEFETEGYNIYGPLKSELSDY